MIQAIDSMNWPAAAILIVLFVCVTVTVCIFRANRVEDHVKSAVDFERAKNARALPPPEGMPPANKG